LHFRHIHCVAPHYFPLPTPKSKLASVQVIAAAVFAALWGLGTAAAAANAPARDNPALSGGGRAYLPGVAVVKIAPTAAKAAVRGADGALTSTGSAALDRMLAAHGVQHTRPVAARIRGPRRPGGTDLSRVFVVELGGGADALAVARELATRPEVEYAEPQFVYPLAAVPGDPLYATEQSTYFQRMQLPAAFDVTRGGNGDVVVAIVDGGTEWRHQDLQANVWTNPGEIAGNHVDDDGNGFVDDVHGWNFANNTNDPTGLAATPGSAGHGTHTAGIACAVTDNNRGVAGGSWNAHFMPVCGAHPTIDNAVAYGYQGILYAVDAGADIVSCSWGGVGNPSQFEQDVTDYAVENGVVVVAAAGNNNSSSEFYPAAYPHVLAVANLGNTDLKSSSSNYGPWVDLAAQGTAIHSTFSNNSYADLSGTSMAAPQVAAACALVKTKFPAYTALQVAERVRVTCDNVDGVNPSFVGLLGHGRVNAVQALTRATPAVRIQRVTATTSDGDAIIEPGETVNLSITVVNYLDPCQQTAFTLSTSSAVASVTSGAAAVSALGSGQVVTLSGFSVTVTAGTPVNTVLPFRLDISTTNPSTTDVDRFELRVLPIAATHAANRVVATVTSVGKLGFAERAGGNGKDGGGFQYAGTGNLLFEGALLLGTGAGTLSNAARGSNTSLQDDDFVTAVDGAPVIAPRAPYAEFGTAAFSDARATVPLGIRVRQESWELATPPYADFLVLSCTLRNTSATTRSGLFAGWFLDWDLDAASYATNQTGFDASRGLAYAWDTGSGPDDYVGALVLTPPGTTTCRGIWNDQNAPGNPSWGIYDGFTDAEKWEALSGGTGGASAGPADISQVVGTGPFTLAPGESVQVAFAFLGGSSLADLQAHADVARSVWQHPVDTGARRPLPLRVQLEPSFPNPFNPETRIAFLLPQPTLVSLRVYAVSGRLVRTLAAGRREAGPHLLLWDGRDDLGRPAPSGTYFLRLAADGIIQTRKLQLVK
jgi:hypothetical protein